MRFTPILRQASRADTLAFIGVGKYESPIHIHISLACPSIIPYSKQYTQTSADDHIILSLILFYQYDV